jgi:uncharacterized membrane protein YeaQ/YmgE (transglycosylase-associated protein family)
MELSHLAVQLIVAIVCASIANILIPRQMPGKFLGLILTGMVGVWLGEQTFRLLRSQYGVNLDLLHWHLLGVPLIPSIIGSAIVLYVVTTFLKWARYTH